MTFEEYSELKDWFIGYTRGFLSRPGADCENILLKREHTLRVCVNMELISEDLDGEDRIPALAAALLHDAGRFEQLMLHGTFSDFRSEDHAALGVRIIRDMGILKNIDPEDASIILTAVENHNKARIAPGLSEREELICRLVRDADKLDIWHLVIEYYREGREKENPSLVHHLPPGDDICTPVFEAIERQETVSYDIMETVVDMKILQMSWVYDLNTSEALRLADERNYLEGIYSSLPSTERITRIYGKMKEYLTTRLEGVYHA